MLISPEGCRVRLKGGKNNIFPSFKHKMTVPALSHLGATGLHFMATFCCYTASNILQLHCCRVALPVSSEGRPPTRLCESGGRKGKKKKTLLHNGSRAAFLPHHQCLHIVSAKRHHPFLILPALNPPHSGDRKSEEEENGLRKKCCRQRCGEVH